MTRLLSAHLLRLRKNRLFWGALALSFGFGVFMVLTRYSEHIRYQIEVSLDTVFFAYAAVVGIVMSVFTSLFLGTEYSDGAIRNKVTAGHPRPAIYLAGLLINILVSFVLCAAYMLAAAAVGLPLIGALTVDFKVILLTLLGVLAMCTAFCAIFTLISMNCSRKATSAVACLLGVFVLLMMALYVNMRLDAQEFYDAYSMDTDGQLASESIPNPTYLRGAARTAFEFFYDFLPTGQALQYSSLSAVHLGRMPLYSLLICVTLSAIGMALFNQKDLK